MGYQDSVQRTAWLFASEDKVGDARSIANSQAVERLLAANPELKVEDLLSPNDELVLLKWFESKIGDFAGSLKLPLKVQATATVYFKRLYLHNSVMDYAPKEMMLVCLYLACKIEESRKTIANFLKPVAKDQDKLKDYILDMELVLAELLSFHLALHHPFHAIEGFCIELITPTDDDLSVINSTTQNNVYREAMILAKLSVTSDVCLLYAPSVVAMSCVYSATEKEGALDVIESNFKAKFGFDERMAQTCRKIVDMINSKAQFDPKVMKRVMKRQNGLRKYVMDTASQEYRTKVEWMGEMLASKQQTASANEGGS